LHSVDVERLHGQVEPAVVYGQVKISRVRHNSRVQHDTAACSVEKDYANEY
jgi:hypothetical protein